MKKNKKKTVALFFMICFIISIINALAEKNISGAIIGAILATTLYLYWKKQPKTIAGEVSTVDSNNIVLESPAVQDTSKQNIENYNPKYKDRTVKWMANFDSVVNNFISIDLETTGLSPVTDRIIEISAVYFKNQNPVQTFSTLINPGIKVPSSASKINHITNKMLKNAPNEREAVKKLMTFISGLNDFSGVFVAYNAKFDGKFLDATMHRLGLQNTFEFFDCYKLAKETFNNVDNYKLVTIAQELGLSTNGSHRATLDAENCGFVLINSYRKMNEEKLTVSSSFSDYDHIIIEQTKEVLNHSFSVSKDKSGYLRFYNNFDLFLTYRKTKTLSYILIDEDYCLEHEIKASNAVASEDGYKRYFVSKSDDLIEISNYIKEEYKLTSKKCNTSLCEAVEIYRSSFVFYNELGN